MQRQSKAKEIQVVDVRKMAEAGRRERTDAAAKAVTTPIKKAEPALVPEVGAINLISVGALRAH